MPCCADSTATPDTSDFPGSGRPTIASACWTLAVSEKRSAPLCARESWLTCPAGRDAGSGFASNLHCAPIQPGFPRAPLGARASPPRSNRPVGGLFRLGTKFPARFPQPGLTSLGWGAAPGAAAERRAPIRTLTLLLGPSPFPTVIARLPTCPAAAPRAACCRLASFVIHFRQTLRPVGFKTRGCAASRVLLTRFLRSACLRTAACALRPGLGAFPCPLLFAGMTNSSKTATQQRTAPFAYAGKAGDSESKHPASPVRARP